MRAERERRRARAWASADALQSQHPLAQRLPFGNLHDGYARSGRLFTPNSTLLQDDEGALRAVQRMTGARGLISVRSHRKANVRAPQSTDTQQRAHR